MSADSQLTFEDDPVYRRFKETQQFIKDGEYRKAYELFEEILGQSIVIPDIYASMKCLKFWLIREENIKSLSEGEKKANYLKEEWQIFEDFILKKSVGHAKVVPLIKSSIFQQIIDSYINQFQSLTVSDVGLLLRISESFLVIEQYKKAKDTLLYARKYKKRDSSISAYLGECFYFLGDEIKALAYFREAFFYQPKKINFEYLHCPIIIELKKKTMENGFLNLEVNLWLPIYAEIENKFYVKKKLIEKELETIQKKIYEYEIQLEISQKNKSEIEPILINHYIHLMDHNKQINQAEEILQNKTLLKKLKTLNEGVYLKLRNQYE